MNQLRGDFPMGIDYQIAYESRFIRGIGGRRWATLVRRSCWWPSSLMVVSAEWSALISSDVAVARGGVGKFAV